MSLASTAGLSPVWAYLDPGSGSLILQVLLATVLSGLFFAKSAFQYVRNAIFRKSQNNG
jgi:hypothetical protein